MAIPNCLCGQSSERELGNCWTIIIYAGVDSSAESHVMPHLEELAAQSKAGKSCEVILFIDRGPGNSDDANVLGENFDDARLFRLGDGRWQRMKGGVDFPEITLESFYEANSGDAETLRKFIKCCKRISPSEHYALVLFGHGDCRSVCPDESEGNAERKERDDPLYSAEITDQLSDTESVDLLWVDACAFGGIENACQFRKKEGRFWATAMLASPPSGDPAPMSKILTDARLLGNKARPEGQPKDAVEFGRSSINSIRAHYRKNPFRAFRESWAVYDLTACDKVKQSLDQLSVLLFQGDNKEIVEDIRGSGKNPVSLNHMRKRQDVALMWVVSPHFDLFDLASRIADSSELDWSIRNAATELARSVEAMVVDSYAGSAYKDFQPGKNGVFVVFPDGDAIFRDELQWAAFQWYHPEKQIGKRYAYGSYDWCSDGASPGNRKVENWFELMDYWFDRDDDFGGVNSYRY